MDVTLFKRNSKGEILIWNITFNGRNFAIPSATISYGLVKGQLRKDNILYVTENKIKSLIRDKKKDGYKEVSGIGLSNYLENIETLDRILPEVNTDINNIEKPMLCKKFEKGKLKYPVYAQPKINGFRCIIRTETKETTLFDNKDYRLVARSRDGSEYVVEHIVNILEDKIIYKDNKIAFDGELYIHGKKLSEIKKHIPIINFNGTLSVTANDPRDIKYYIFDLAINDTIQNNRFLYLSDIFNKGLCIFESISEYENHLKYLTSTNDIVVIVLPVIIHNDKEAENFRDLCISYGFEGAIFRTITGKYEFGKRSNNIYKYKKYQDKEFLIVDIIPKPNEPETALFVMKNDINDELFECNPEGDYETRKEYLVNKYKYIGRYATIKFYERSGVKSVPFHANLINII